MVVGFNGNWNVNSTVSPSSGEIDMVLHKETQVDVGFLDLVGFVIQILSNLVLAFKLKNLGIFPLEISAKNGKVLMMATFSAIAAPMMFLPRSDLASVLPAPILLIMPGSKG